MIERAATSDLDEVLGLFDAVQAWLVDRGLKEQWGDAPFSGSETQRQRFAGWLDAGDFRVLRRDRQIVGTLQFSAEPPAYARAGFAGREAGGYIEAFAVHRDYAGQGVGEILLEWAGQEAERRHLNTLHLDCWAENRALRAYYHRAGFREVETLALGGWRGVLFEKMLATTKLQLEDQNNS